MNITPKMWTTITGVLILAAMDVLAWRKAWNAAVAEGRAHPKFDWIMAVPKWIIGGLAGDVVGTGVESIPGID